LISISCGGGIDRRRLRGADYGENLVHARKAPASYCTVPSTKPAVFP
jgi:hypothetical protein